VRVMRPNLNLSPGAVFVAIIVAHKKAQTATLRFSAKTRKSVE